MTILKLTEDIFINISKILNVTYEVLQSSYDINGNPSNVYGLKVYLNEDNLLNSNDESCEISDISSNKDFVIDLAVKLARNQALPIHTRDIVEDSILIDCLQ